MEKTKRRREPYEQHQYPLLFSANGAMFAICGAPSVRLARALGVVVERPGDRVQFSVRMTRAERDALLQQIAASGMTRREWLER